jgi:DNA-directed RNA polymerase subunit RPC12/RpoP
MLGDKHELMVRGIAAAKAGDVDEARLYLQWVLQRDPDFNERSEVSLWMSRICDDPKEKRHWLEEALANNPNEPRARRELAILDGRLKPDEVVDPDKVSTQSELPPQPANGERLECPKCGGRMAYAPDGLSLICDFCGARPDGGNLNIEEQDFIVALATAKGHQLPVEVSTFTCDACGASYVVPAKTLSITCAHCAADYAIDRGEKGSWIPPQAIAPFELTQEQVWRRMRVWFKEQGIDEAVPHLKQPQGVYLPAWTFDVGGMAEWRATKVDDKGYQETVTGLEPVLLDDLIVPASERLSEELLDRLYDPEQMRFQPYQPGFLADWPAETYDRTVSDAALIARQHALEYLKRIILRPIGVEDFIVLTSGMMVDSYKLVLLPVWIGHYQLEEKTYEWVVNGQSGELYVDGVSPSWTDRIARWLLGK